MIIGEINIDGNVDKLYDEYINLQKNFPTDCGDYKCYLFMDEKLMMKFLRSLPQKGLLNIRVGFDFLIEERFLDKGCYWGDLFTDWGNYVLLEIESDFQLYKKKYINVLNQLDRLDELENLILKKSIIDGKKLSGLDFYHANSYSNMFVHIYIWWYKNCS